MDIRARIILISPAINHMAYFEFNIHTDADLKRFIWDLAKEGFVLQLVSLAGLHSNAVGFGAPIPDSVRSKSETPNGLVIQPSLPNGSSRTACLLTWRQCSAKRKRLAATSLLTKNGAPPLLLLPPALT
jgi:hypothetical protein